MRTVTSGLSDDDLAYLRRAAASPGTIETLATVDREIDARHVLPAVRVPTLVVHAAEDPTFPVGGARYMAERIPGAKLVEVPGNESLTDRLLDESEQFLHGVWEAGGWEEPEPERVLATILFTDIVGSTERAAVLGDRAWHELLAASPRAGTAAARQVPGARGRHRRRRVLCELRRAGAGDPVRPGDRRGRAHAGAGGARGSAHRRVRAVGREGGGDRRPHRRPRCGPGRAGRGAGPSTVKGLVAGSGIAFEDRGTHELAGVPDEWRLYAVEQA